MMALIEILILGAMIISVGLILYGFLVHPIVSEMREWWRPKPGMEPRRPMTPGELNAYCQAVEEDCGS